MVRGREVKGKTHTGSEEWDPAKFRGKSTPYRKIRFSAGKWQLAVRNR